MKKLVAVSSVLLLVSISTAAQSLDDRVKPIVASFKGKVVSSRRTSTPREMVLVLEKLERGEIISPAVSKEMIELMKREQGRNAIGRSLWNVSMASKYGALDRLRSAVGILYTKNGSGGQPVRIYIYSLRILDLLSFKKFDQGLNYRVKLRD